MQDNLSLTFAALADPTRRAMLSRLSQGEANVSDLAKPFLGEMSLPAITKHLKVLEKAGLITKTREAQWRPCRINAEAFKDVADWMEQYRVYWEESFDRLDAYLKTITSKTGAQKTNSQIHKRKNLKSNQKTKMKGKRNGRKK
jgi:DNA-binding transcriptional ArsR family regulator